MAVHARACVWRRPSLGMRTRRERAALVWTCLPQCCAYPISRPVSCQASDRGTPPLLLRDRAGAGRNRGALQSRTRPDRHAHRPVHYEALGLHGRGDDRVAAAVQAGLSHRAAAELPPRLGKADVERGAPGATGLRPLCLHRLPMPWSGCAPASTAWPDLWLLVGRAMVSPRASTARRAAHCLHACRPQRTSLRRAERLGPSVALSPSANPTAIAPRAVAAPIARPRASQGEAYRKKMGISVRADEAKPASLSLVEQMRQLAMGRTSPQHQRCAPPGAARPPCCEQAAGWRRPPAVPPCARCTMKTTLPDFLPTPWLTPTAQSSCCAPRCLLRAQAAVTVASPRQRESRAAGQGALSGDHARIRTHSKAENDLGVHPALAQASAPEPARCVLGTGANLSSFPRITDSPAACGVVCAGSDGGQMQDQCFRLPSFCCRRTGTWAWTGVTRRSRV